MAARGAGAGGGKRKQSSACLNNKKTRLSKNIDLHIALRHVQRQSRCTTTTLKSVLQVLKPFLNIDTSRMDVWRATKNIYKRTGATLLKLNGCVGCDDYVFLPDEHNDHCPLCGHERYSNAGNANEVML